MPPSTESAFYGVYLLQSRAVPGSKRTYIGFTVDPRRRLRQHNGELASGAWKTHRHRPWDMLLVVHGFATHAQALAFEWAWQNPTKSKGARDAVASLQGRGTTAAAGARGRIRVLFAMLNAPAWSGMPLVVTVLSSSHEHLLCPPSLPREEAERGLPRGMRVETAPVETLVVGRIQGNRDGEEPLERDPEAAGSGSEEEGEEGGRARAGEEGQGQGHFCCSVCSREIDSGEDFIPCRFGSSASSTSPACRARSHPDCLADRFLSEDSTGGGVVPTRGTCPSCGGEVSWLSCLRASQQRRREETVAASTRTAASRPSPSPTKKARARRRRRPAVPKATQEELDAFAALRATTTAANEGEDRNNDNSAFPPSPSKKSLQQQQLPGTAEEPILIGSSSSDEDNEEKKAPLRPLPPPLPLSPLVSRLARLSTPNDAGAAAAASPLPCSLSRMRGGARPAECRQEQERQASSLAAARPLSSSPPRSSSSAAAAGATARRPRRPLPLPPPSSFAATAAATIAAVASRRARAARALRGLLL